tara:strand:- start:95 stop:982 length:888 start_codon:yes stop_codon:yes gene_type:complete
MTQNSYDPTADGLLRVSKSSFMLYNTCPRKYWWQHIGLPDIREPATPQMIRGTNIHKIAEAVLTTDGATKVREKAYQMLKDMDMHITDMFMDETLASLDEEIRKQFGEYEVIMCEEKISALDDKHNVMLVGSLDGVLRFWHTDDEGNEHEYIALVEVKTGNWSTGKLGRTRRELCFYTKLLHHHSGLTPTHFLYITPDYDPKQDAYKMVDDFRSKKNKHVVQSAIRSGVAWMERINPRSINAFMKAYDKTIEGIQSMDFNIKWNDYYCGQYCSYMVQCEPEMMGLADDPTKEEQG